MKSLVIACIAYTLFFRNNFTPISHFLLSRKYTPSSDLRIKSAIRQLNHVNNSKGYTFIDYGCGEGHVLRQTQTLFKKIYGVELDPGVAERARNNTLRSIPIMCGDFMYFKPTVENTIIFMYHPLHQLPTSKSRVMYKKLFTDLRERFIDKDLIICYLSGLVIPHINETFITDCGYEKISGERVGALYWYTDVNVYRASR